MSQIMNALTELNQSLEQLEDVAAQHEQKILYIKQQELFAENNQPKKTANGHNGVDTAVVAQKLDGAIQRVEQLLAEGAEG